MHGSMKVRVYIYVLLKDPAIQISGFSHTCDSGSTLMSTQGTQYIVKTENRVQTNRQHETMPRSHEYADLTNFKDCKATEFP